MTTDNSEIVHVSGKETERIGTEAFVFIELKGWEVISSTKHPDRKRMLTTLATELQNVALGVDGDPLHRWYSSRAKVPGHPRHVIALRITSPPDHLSPFMSEVQILISRQIFELQLRLLARFLRSN